MANPQLEDGHTQIANEILEHLAIIHLSPNQWQVLICLIRKTYGYRKKVDYIANCQICQATGLGKSVVSRSLNILAEMQVIIRDRKTLGIQKNWEEWREVVSNTANKSKLNRQQKLAEQATKVSNTANNSRESTPEKLAISSTELAISSTKVSSPAVIQKKKETIQKKSIYKNKMVETLEEFTNRLRLKYPSLDFDFEIEKCNLWWEGKKSGNMKLRIANWMQKSEQYRIENRSNGNGTRTDSLRPGATDSHEENERLMQEIKDSGVNVIRSQPCP